jgi:hypothetical protein
VITLCTLYVITFEYAAHVKAPAKTLRYIYDYNNDDFNGLRTPILEKNLSSLVCSDDNDDIKAPITLYRIASERRDFCNGLGSCFHYATDYNPVRAAARKSLRFGGDMKSNPVCAVPDKTKCNNRKSDTLRCDISFGAKF